MCSVNEIAEDTFVVLKQVSGWHGHTLFVRVHAKLECNGSLHNIQGRRAK